MSENISEIITSTINVSSPATSVTVASSSGIDDQKNKNNYKNNDNDNHNESLPQIKLPFPPKIDPSDLIHPAKPVTNISAFDEPHKPSRAPNAFIIYRKAFVKAARDEGHCLPMTVISSMASAAWEKESEKVKTEYKRISKEAHLKKKAMYPKERRRRRKERWNVVSFQQPNIIKHHENNEDQYNNNNNNNNNDSNNNNNNITIAGINHNNSNNNNGYYLPPESPIFTSQYTHHLIDLFSTPHISMLENYETENNNINNNNDNDNNQYNSMVVINNNLDVMVNSLINNENANNNDLFQLQQQRSGDFSYLNLLNAVTTPDLSSSSSDENCSNLSSPSLPNDDESVIINCNENDTYNIYPDVDLFNFNLADIYSTPNYLLNKLDGPKSSPSISSSSRLSTSSNIIINNSNTSSLLPSFFDNVPEFNSEFNYGQL